MSKGFQVKNYFGPRHYVSFEGDVRVHYVQRVRNKHGDGWRFVTIFRGLVGKYGCSHPRYATKEEAIEALRMNGTSPKVLAADSRAAYEAALVAHIKN